MGNPIATPNQVKYLWSFEIRFGPAGHQPENWFNLQRQGRLSKREASVLIGACKEWEKDQKNPDLKALVLNHIKQFAPKFSFRDGDAPAPQPQPSKPVPVPEIDPNCTDAELFDTLRGVLDGKLYELIRKRYDDKSVPQMPEVEIEGDYIKPDIFDSVRLALSVGRNMLVFGPAGCGKSRMAKELAATLELEFFPFSCSGGQRYSQVFGSTQMRIDPETGKQYTEFVESELLQAVQKPSLILLDEIFGADPDVALGLNGLLEADTRSINTPKGLITVHEQCRFIACANTNGRTISRQFTGAQRHDDSLSDRFVKKHMGYSKEVEEALLQACARQADRNLLHQKLYGLRDKLKAANIPFDASTRRLISAIKLCNAGMNADEAFEMSFLEDLSESERAKVQM